MYPDPRVQAKARKVRVADVTPAQMLGARTEASGDAINRSQHTPQAI